MNWPTVFSEENLLSLFTEVSVRTILWRLIESMSSLFNSRACHGIAAARLSSGYLLNIHVGQAWAMAFCSAGDKPLPQPVRSKIPEVYPGGNPPVTGGSFSQNASNAELWCILWCLPKQTVGQQSSCHWTQWGIQMHISVSGLCHYGLRPWPTTVSFEGKPLPYRC